MANRRDTFAKRQRETDLKQRAREKQVRRDAKRSEVRTTKGPQIAWDEAHHMTSSEEPAPAPAPAPASPAAPATASHAGPDDSTE